MLLKPLLCSPLRRGEELMRPRTWLVVGLLHLSTLQLRTELMPPVCTAYAALMSCLVSVIGTRAKDLQREVQQYTSLLRDRPSELPEFVAYMEATWPHLDEGGAKRQAVRQAHDYLAKLYDVLMSAVRVSCVVYCCAALYPVDLGPWRRGCQQSPGLCPCGCTFGMSMGRNVCFAMAMSWGIFAATQEV